MTKAIENVIAKNPLYSQDGKGGDAKVIAKFFFGAWTWFVLEGNKLENVDYEFFGIVENQNGREYGYFTLSELESVKMWGYPVVERDRYFKSCKVSELN